MQDNIQFSGPNSNEKRLKFYIKFTGGYKEIFTAKDIAFLSAPSVEYPKIQMKTINRHNQVEPPFPDQKDNAWNSLGDIPKVLPNTKEAYPDLIDKTGYISTRHYNYKYNSTVYGAGSIPPRAETFDYPIGENMVIQTSSLDSQKQYHSTKDQSSV